MRLNKGDASSAVGREWVLLGWFHCSTDRIVLTITLIDLARPPFFLLSTAKYAIWKKKACQTLYKTWHWCDFCVGIFLPICLQDLTEDLLGCHFQPTKSVAESSNESCRCISSSIKQCFML